MSARELEARHERLREAAQETVDGATVYFATISPSSSPLTNGLQRLRAALNDESPPEAGPQTSV